MKKSFTMLIVAAMILVSASACNNNTVSQTSDSSASQSTDDKTSNPESSVDDESSTTHTDSNSSSAPESSETEETSDTDSTPSLVPGLSYDDLDELKAQIAATANSLIGIDYNMGGDTIEEGFDNSGFIYYVLRENGYINCPRNLEAQLTMGTKIEFKDIMPGDILFYTDTDSDTGEKSYFGGIYVGEGKLVYSPYPGEKVKYGEVNNSYWTEHYSHAVRV